MKIILKKRKIEGDLAKIDSENYNVDKDIDVLITYVFKKINDKWMLVDLILNEHNLIEAYKLQINRIVEKRGITGLIKKINEKYMDLADE